MHKMYESTMFLLLVCLVPWVYIAYDHFIKPKEPPSTSCASTEDLAKANRLVTTEIAKIVLRGPLVKAECPVCATSKVTPCPLPSLGSTREPSLVIDGDSVSCVGLSECPFHSQFGEDREMVLHMAKTLKTMADFPTGPGFTVLEIGGNNGVHFSDSFFYEQFLNWKAVHLEPSRISYPLLVKNRPRAVNLRVASCIEESVVTFTERIDNSLVSGVASEMSNAFKGQWHSSGPHQDYNVTCGPLSKYLPMVGVDRVEIFFLDIEGGEYAALQGIDFNSTSFHYLVIEMDGGDPEREEKLRAFLKGNAYEVKGKIGVRNELFENMVWG